MKKEKKMGSTAMTSEIDPAVGKSVGEILREAQVLAEDYDADLADALRLAVEEPLSPDELHELFTKIIVRLRAGRDAERETKERIAVEVREMVDDLVSQYREANPSQEQEHVELEVEHGGLHVRPVVPAPTFLGDTIALMEGFVDVTHLKLWPGNHRLELHLVEFRKNEGRSPTSEELLNILLSKIQFQGVAPKDRVDSFKIKELAESIANNGVRVAPIIDWHGMPYDGNRRLAACLYVLSSDEYTDHQKKNARWIKVWQAPKETTPDQIKNIVVALNFEKNLKEPWPEYVRAKQVFDEFQKALDLAVATEANPDVTKIRRKVGKGFGIRTDEVTRYVRMVEWANEFSEYHQDEKGRDEAEVLHRTNKYFQYFYELDSGRNDAKLSHKLDQNDELKALVFDLLYEDRFKNWTQIRDLRRVFADENATEILIDAATTPDDAVGRARVEEAISAARRHDIARRQIGAQQRVEEFTKWLETEATQATWRDHVNLDALKRFLAAVRAAEGTLQTVLDERIDGSLV